MARRVFLQYFSGFRDQGFRISADQPIAAAGDGHGTLRIFAKREAGHAKVGCFLLDSSRIGDHHSAAVNQGEKVQI